MEGSRNQCLPWKKIMDQLFTFKDNADYASPVSLRLMTAYQLGDVGLNFQTWKLVSQANDKTGQKENRSQNLKVQALCLKLTHICLNQVRCVLLSFHFLIYEITVTPGLQRLCEFPAPHLLSLSVPHIHREHLCFSAARLLPNANEPYMAGTE